jgi:hypothetical protein
MEVKTVLIRRDGIKMVIIPKNSNIKAGEKVLITNNLKLINKFIEEEKNARRKS